MVIGSVLLLALGVSFVGMVVRLLILKIFTPPYTETLWYFVAWWIGIAVALFLMASGPLVLGK